MSGDQAKGVLISEKEAFSHRLTYVKTSISNNVPFVGDSRAEKRCSQNYVPERIGFYGSQYVVQSNNCEHAKPIMWASVLAKQSDLAKRCNLGQSCFCAHRDIAEFFILLFDGFKNKTPKELGAL